MGEMAVGVKEGDQGLDRCLCIEEAAIPHSFTFLIQASEEL